MYHTSYRWPNWLVVPTRLHDPSTLHTTQRTHCKKKRVEIKIIRLNITVVPATNPVCRLVSESKDSGNIVRIFSKAGIMNELCRKVEIPCGICEVLWWDIILHLVNHQNEPKNPKIQPDSQSRILHGPAILLQRTQTKKATVLLWL